MTDLVAPQNESGPDSSEESEVIRLRAELAHLQRMRETKKELTVTPASEWEEPFDPQGKGFIHELPSGRVVRMRRLPLVQELLAGTLPNRVTEQVIFGKDLRSIDPDDEKNAEQVQRHVEGLVNIAVRALLEPKMVIDRKPDTKKGEVSQFVFTLPDLQEIRFEAVYARLKAVVEDPPFRPVTDESGTGGGAPLPE